ncbi:M23 family metallopeptidase [Corynebacterium timonense]|nr:peptidoglycan DD-metalloendopeptidase family protein [Corynebacterium timonense]
MSAVVLFATAPVAAAWIDPSRGTPAAARVTRSAQIPEKNWLPGHRGVDLALSPGEPVRAAGAGTVAYVGVVVGVPTVSIDHPEGIRTTYQPVHARVRVGDTVDEGQVIGTLAASHAHEGLHWGALTGPDTYINPLSLLSAPTIRLKPVPAP